MNQVKLQLIYDRAVYPTAYQLLTHRCLNNGKLAGIGSPSLSIMAANGRTMFHRMAEQDENVIIKPKNCPGLVTSQ